MLKHLTAELVARDVAQPDENTALHLDECSITFDTPYSDGGLFTSLRTWVSFSSDCVQKDHERTQQRLYLHTAKSRPAPDQPVEIHRCLVCLPEDERVPLPSSVVLPLALTEAVDAALSLPAQFCVSAKVRKCAKAMRRIFKRLAEGVQEEEAEEGEAGPRPSLHADSLSQVQPLLPIPNDPCEWRCAMTGEEKNLWLNLSDGCITVGLLDFGLERPEEGPKESKEGEASSREERISIVKQHCLSTGHWLAVKLDSLSSRKATVFSFAPDEMCKVKDPYLRDHLAFFGIDPAVVEESRAMRKQGLDLQVVQAITESLSSLEPVRGPGRVGLANLGNSCYANAVLQLIMAIPAAEEAFTGPATPHNWPCWGDNLATNLEVQLCKLYKGLHSSRYTQQPLEHEGEEEAPRRHPGTRTGWLKPLMLRALVGEGHSEFSGYDQQDAAEYLVHLLQLIQRRPEPRVLPSELEKGFAIEFEDRFLCHRTGEVRYCRRVESLLTLEIPVDKATNLDAYQNYTAQRRKHQLRGALAALGKSPPGSICPTESDASPVVLEVPFAACLGLLLRQEETVEEFGPQRTLAAKTVAISAFPRYLVVQLRRYLLDHEWKPQKLECAVEVPDELDLEAFRGQGIQPGETPLAEEEDSGGGAGEQEAVERVAGELQEMGFHPNACLKAARASAGTAGAMNWLLARMDDPDINQDPPTGNEEATAAAIRKDGGEAVQGLTAMGFSMEQAECGLARGGGGVEQAAEWLLTNIDRLEQEVAQYAGEKENARGEVPGVVEDGPGRYVLRGFISHIGRNTGCGHYVAHIKKEGAWLKYDDSRVFASALPPKAFGYLYLYERAS